MEPGSSTFAENEEAQQPPPAKKRKIFSCYPFDKNIPLPDEAEKKRLIELQQGSEEWLKERLKRIGASSSSCAVGLGPATPRDYWRLKTHRIERDDDEASLRRMQRGNDLEEEAASAYAIFMNCRLGIAGIVVHPSIPWIHCSPDRIILEGEGSQAGDRGIVEIKCPQYCVPLRIKDQYLVQTQQQMEVMDVEWCDLVFYYKNDATGEVEVEIWRLWRNREYWAIVLDRLDTFADCLMDKEQEPLPSLIPLRPQMPRVKKQKKMYRKLRFLRDK